MGNFRERKKVIVLVGGISYSCGVSLANDFRGGNW